MKVTAEGVETAEQHLFLRAAGVHFMQGYRFGKPEPAAAITERLARRRRAAAPRPSHARGDEEREWRVANSATVKAVSAPDAEPLYPSPLAIRHSLFAYSPRPRARRERVGVTFDDVGRRRCDQPHHLVHRSAGTGAISSLLRSASLEELAIRGERREGRAQRRDPVRRHAGRRHDRPRRRLLREVQLQDLAVAVRPSRSPWRTARPAAPAPWCSPTCISTFDLLVAHPVGAHRLHARPRPVADAVHLAALDRERDQRGRVVAGARS